MVKQTSIQHEPDRTLLGADRPHFIGIGGCGMSALAMLLNRAGVAVTGTDATESPTTLALAEAGVGVTPDGPSAEIPEDADLVVASAAISPDHPGLLEAQRRGVDVMTYAEALGRVMLARTGVAVAGTHGKSTTCAMLGCVLTDAGLDPSVIVGATCPQLSEGALSPLGKPLGYRLGPPLIPAGPLQGQPGVLIAEACEYNRSFHALHPKVAAIGSVEADHLDVYASVDEIVRAFNEFARRLPSAADGGRLLIAHEGAHRTEVTAGVTAKIETIGFGSGSDWRIDHAPADNTVRLQAEGVDISWTSRMPGEHNAFNAGFAAALAIRLGADPARVAKSLSAFAGLDRRCSHLGDVTLPHRNTEAPVRVFDDYGHHPTEVDKTLRALRQREKPEANGGRLICVFQPHQHSRTRFLLDEFASAFSNADIVIVPHIYFVRDSEAERHRVSAADLVDRLRSRGQRAMHLYPFEAIVEQLENIARPGDVLVVMGAGPVWHVAVDFIKRFA